MNIKCRSAEAAYDLTRHSADASTGPSRNFVSFKEARSRACSDQASRSRLKEGRKLTKTARDLTRPPSPQSSEPVRVRGDQLSVPTFWQGRQCAVTSYGIECRNGTYPIKRDRLWENDEVHGWVQHMADKDWVDLPDFAEALRVARQHFAHSPKPGAGPEEIGDVFHRRGQRYEIVDVHSHLTRDDRLVPLCRLRSHCAECGRPFEFSTRMSSIRRGGDLNRRCELHRRAGVPVEPTPRRRPRNRQAEPRRVGPSRQAERRSA
jgi:hypothetical protein